MTDQERILSKLGALWLTRSHRTLGQLIEQVEDRAWSLIPERYVSTRLMNLPDGFLENALDLMLLEVREPLLDP